MVAGSCVASASDSGRPSGMVAKRNDDDDAVRPATAAPRERTRRRWLYSVLTKVTRKPLAWRILASFSIGVMWPCVGNGTHTACGCGSGSWPVGREAALMFALTPGTGRVSGRDRIVSCLYSARILRRAMACFVAADAQRSSHASHGHW